MFDLYGAGLERIVSAADDSTLDAFLGDELVSHLLLLHGLHPLPVEQRVTAALDEVRPYLRSHGGEVELVEVSGDTVRLRLAGSCSGCPSSTMTLKLAIENAIQKAAPEIEQVIAVDDAPAPAAAPPLLQIEVAPALEGAWTTVGSLRELAGGGLVVKQVEGAPLALLRIGTRLYANRARCPACEASLDGAELAGTELTCSGCGNRYDALRAGRGLDLPELHLEPVPLLEGEDGLVRIALPALA
jgi:Fe-S cluster biogenesis protein NfuA/nitrite reductase/ring-hydroxylating ferredoxin subunit